MNVSASEQGPFEVPSAQDAGGSVFRAGFVAVVGRPNVGKSTLINTLLGQKIAIVSPKPQTTRNRLLGILTQPEAQVVFIDTPGIHVPLHKLGEVMVKTAEAALPDADLVLWVVDVSVPPHEEDRQVSRVLAANAPQLPVILALNKADLLKPPEVQSRVAAYTALAPDAAWELVSAIRGDNLENLVAQIVGRLPLSPPLYPDDQVTDQQVRFMAGELVREQLLNHLRDEVPHAAVVLVDRFEEREDGLTYISAVIYVERDTQKPIVLGKGGEMIKRIGQAARAQIEELLETRVYLDLWVKVRSKWRTDEEQLRRLGYRMPKLPKGKGGVKAKGVT